MAVGGVDIQAQHAYLCENCDALPAHYFCKTCPGQLCEPCKVQHLQRKISSSHQIMAFTGTIPESREYGFCRVHPEAKYEICCRLCEVPVCARCLTGSHNGHVLAEIPKVYEQLKNSMLQDLKDLDDIILPEHDALIDEANDHLVSLEHRIDDMKNEMKDHAKMLTDMIKKNLHARLKQIELSNEVYEDLQMQVFSLQERKQQLSNLKSDIESLLDSDDMVELMKFRQDNSIFNEMYRIPNSCSCKNPEFLPGKIDAIQLLNQFGACTSPLLQRKKGYTVPCKHRINPESTRKKKLLKSAKKIGAVKMDTKNNILTFCVGDDKFWAVGDENKISQFDDRGKALVSLKISKNLGQASGLAILRTGNVLFSCFENKKIVQLFPNSAEVWVKATTEWHPTGLCVCRNDDILVSQVSQPRDVGHSTRRGLVSKYSKSWNLLLKISSDGNHDLFSQPDYIAENVNQDICVSDALKQRVIVLTYEGKKRFSYRGMAQKFDPRQLSTDSLGNIVVADNANRCVHLLSKDGMFLSVIVTKLNEAHGLGLDGEDRLYELGWMSKRMKIYKYLENPKK